MRIRLALSTIFRWLGCGCFTGGYPRRNITVAPEPQVTTVSFFGLDGSGKSTVVDRIVGNPMQRNTTTWGFNSNTTRIDNKALRTFDVGGHARIRGIWQNYYAEAHALCFVLDGSDPARFAEAKKCLNDMCRNKLNQGKPLLVYINKAEQMTKPQLAAANEALGVHELLTLVGGGSTAEPGSPAVPPIVLVHAISAAKVGKRGKGVDRELIAGITELLEAVASNWDPISARVRRDTEQQKMQYAIELEQRRTRVAANSAQQSSSGPNSPILPPKSAAGAGKRASTAADSMAIVQKTFQLN
ncbi:ADP-ribosylation factor family-domain-containing protein [Blastocladiella britannica]|nr:ADP-ribosylation factor family-domain-containing protein [Blastocladiella britannica]